ncbi:semaphorin-7A-like [Engraulis encrasicolus]|uniref:semaphorin-7A-like n=1 Tax=Engraulis encrasicolus TaxID=184585 RepID=UPI002FCF97F7
MAHVVLHLFSLLVCSLVPLSGGFHTARLKLTKTVVAFPRRELQGYAPSNTQRLLQANGSIYAGSGQLLFRLSFQTEYSQEQIPDTLCTDSACGITVMQPGKDGYPLLVCTAKGDQTNCCHMDTNGSLDDCRKGFTRGGEPALLTGDALYTTYSGAGYRNGVYRSQQGTLLMPSGQADQRYVKILEKRDRDSPLQDRLYAFYTEKTLDQDQQSDIFIPRVSQICMSDVGGSKDILQYQWTSQLIGRLSCGDPDRNLFYSELLDVAVLPSAQGESDLLYGLFRNAWEMRAVCVYSMNDISQVFSTSDFTIPTDSFVERPGECVSDSRKLSPDLLKFMKKGPEVVEWVKPVGNRPPLLVSHRHYTHIQVDSVGGQDIQDTHKVLLLSMESGAVHKVLENGSDPFIIAEYHPFQPGTHILSMLLDSSEKKLYVGSSAEVVQIDLKTCSVYGKRCEDCILARDPYCGWDHEQKMCSPYSQNTIQYVEDGDFHKCTDGVTSPSTGGGAKKGTFGIQESSRHYLSCPVLSQHAEYRWLHDGQERSALMDRDQSQLVLLIEDMGASDQGLYRCVSSEGDYNKTVAQYSLRLSSGGQGTRGNILALVSVVVMGLLLS